MKFVLTLYPDPGFNGGRPLTWEWDQKDFDISFCLGQELEMKEELKLLPNCGPASFRAELKKTDPAPAKVLK